LSGVVGTIANVHFWPLKSARARVIAGVSVVVCVWNTQEANADSFATLIIDRMEYPYQISFNIPGFWEFGTA